jgi:hypothetical protein
LTEALEYLTLFGRLPFSLCRFLRRSLTLDEARAIIQRRMGQRADRLLLLVERSIFGRPGSPYWALMKMAGCEMGDVRALVRQEGVEGALRALREAGVYVTFEEFKGRKAIERGGVTMDVTPNDFDNLAAQHEFTIRTGGSTGTAMSVGVGFDDIAARAPHEMVFFDAHDLLRVPGIRWSGTLPAFTLRSVVLEAMFGRPLTRWYSPTGVTDSRHWVKYALASYYITAWLKLCGVDVPWPETVRPDQALAVARGVEEVLQDAGGCSVTATVSLALRVCLAAQEAGIDLRGCTFVGTSEPATPAKVRRVRSTGARLTTNYGMVEASRIGVGCARSDHGDDVHLVKDAYALFSYPCSVPGFDVTVPAFNLTSLLPTSPKVLLNLQMDDYGIVEERECGCALDTCGYATHIRDIRSYSKLTGEGVTLIGDEIVRVLEEVLPARFGGSPLDYQLVESEDERGFTRLSLVISPHVHIRDEGEVTAVVLRALGESSSMADAARTVWENTETLRVWRRKPIVTDRGKQFPLRLLRRSEDDCR